MERQDFWTHIGVAVAAFVVMLPDLLTPWQGPWDLYTSFFLSSDRWR